MKTALTAPRPLDVLQLPDDLDGRTGVNRATGRRQIAADDDLAAVRAWLARVADTKTTFENYRKEAERLLLWSIVQLGKPLSSLTHEDLLGYQRFLADPQPRDRWVAAGRKFARDDPRWRPFHGPLAASSQRQAMVILNALFSWLVGAGYLAGNPLSLSRQRARRAAPRVTRFLELDLWQEVKLYINSLPRDTDRERARYWRARWLFTLLYLGGLRISEVSGNTMGDFFCRRDAGGHERWWLEITGKGDKARLVPASTEMMIELGHYRSECGLPVLPAGHEDTPLVLPLGQSTMPLTRAALHTIVKGIFAGAAEKLRMRGEEYAARAAQLERASAHWLRHSAGSHMADCDVDLRMIRDNLGHVSLTTTSLYLHADDDDRHQKTEQKHRMGW
ncbi:tyrosine-type recombinase/integrase [Burkholderia vietnamiensis]|uniref:Integrase n=2 Tax=Burkholderia cepacia complex TaxID=87882 RepID=A0AA45BBY5_BURVI|nr:MULTISPECIES: tyrosine-type recombinase/integrase [Burkholderiaceae]KVR74410.1 integrase [Burkholderia vietnamiensis]KVS03081.1 integrase [Burkholderia vietnamiensis]KVS32295.1 integrase [Burkholderia vietnamiensis]MBH9647808.1 tyrosine-type recombinase/integrase [Burkholderia vietnamiensis]MBR7912049.1 tyrosine-type recombinase/integrase [Burkholderia vietnamiensis]